MSNTIVYQATTPHRIAKVAGNQSENMNHLLNFSLPPRQQQSLSSLPRRSKNKDTGRRAWTKERFVNAQYRFVMDPAGDYTAHFADPDIFFQWPDVLQVIIPRSSTLAYAAVGGELSSQDGGHTICPICISPPSAPRMTKCGHVFCFPCILHYLSTTERQWAKCPVCFDSVYEHHLKSVKWYDETAFAENMPTDYTSSVSDHVFRLPPRTGSTLRMRLIQRPKITTLALPRSSTWPSDLLPPHQAPFHFLPDVFSFAKFMLATPDYLVTDLTRDLDDLCEERHRQTEMKDNIGIMFVENAKSKVKQQIAKVMALATPILKSRIKKAKRGHEEVETRRTVLARHKKKEVETCPPISPVPEELLAVKTASIATSNAILKPTTPQPHNTSPQRKNNNPPPPSTSTFYYYQAASGLPLFLHPLDIRILLSHFNNYASFPDNITVRVENAAEGTVNDDLRKSCRYLAHMPEGADVVFVEADLLGVVGAGGLKNFKSLLRVRANRRREKGKKEERARVRGEERDRERRKADMSWMDNAPPMQPIVEPVRDVEDDFPALVGGAQHGGMLQRVEELSRHVMTGAPRSGRELASGAPSFAPALHSSAVQGRPTSHRGGRRRRGRRTGADDMDNDFNINLAWCDLERLSMFGR